MGSSNSVSKWNSLPPCSSNSPSFTQYFNNNININNNNSKHIYNASHVPGTTIVPSITHIHIQSSKNLWGLNYYYTHFIDEESEAQRRSPPFLTFYHNSEMCPCGLSFNAITSVSQPSHPTHRSPRKRWSTISPFPIFSIALITVWCFLTCLSSISPP